MKKQQTGKYRQEPNWRPKRLLFASKIDPAIANWLFDPASLTERLIRATQGNFRVKVLQQGWAKPMINEAQRLKMANTEYGLVRQVHLLCNDQPTVYARTVIPPQTLRGKQRRLSRLGQKPLGAVLFADKSMHRTEMELAKITPGQAIHKIASQHLQDAQQDIWGRRSVFYLQQHPLLVSEIFLPTIKNLL